ncbi:MAG: glycosyltransferase family 4 protein [Bacillota bacterium]
MKILFLASYITILDDKNFTKNITGYGYMVRDIADYVSRTGVEVDVITSSAITKGRKYNAFTILKRTWIDLMQHIKPYHFKKTLQLIRTYHPSHRRMVKMLYYALSAGYVEHILIREDYDMVHIHGIDFGTKPYIDCCEKLGIKYVVTLHGLNSFSDSVQMECGEKQFEKDFLQYAYENSIPLTVISTGILNVIKDYLGVQGEIEHFHVVPNGTDISEKTCVLDIRQKYEINGNKKIMLCVGNLSKRKNQVQVVRAYALLPEEIKSCLCILFLGKDATNSEVERKIYEFGLENNLILCGNVNKDEIGSYYKQADYTVLASISEGFGLSIIEGFVYGLPNLTYADLDAIEDLFDEQAMLALTERSDEALAKSICYLLSKDWDRKYIKQYAEKFSLEHMAQEYVKVYQEVVVE